MKYSKKLAYLQARIKVWEQSGGKNTYSGILYKKPGSEKK